jgi:soluble lytic murein transglycosylase-like protein
MVTRLLCTLASIACCGAAQAQDVDWARAGGPLFVGAGPAPADASLGPGFADQADPDPLRAMVDAAADRAGVDRKLLHGLVAVESSFRPRAVSPAGAAGLTQLMPGTAADLGVRDRFDPAENLAGGAAYLRAQIARFGDLRLALAAYNAGPGRVLAARDVPAIPETREFVDDVVSCVLAQMIGRAVRSAKDCEAERFAP